MRWYIETFRNFAEFNIRASRKYLLTDKNFSVINKLLEINQEVEK